MNLYRHPNGYYIRTTVELTEQLYPKVAIYAPEFGMFG